MGYNAHDTFRDIEKGHEAKYKHDEELRFKADARRNKLLGQWSAERLGMTSAETEVYVKEVVMADLEQPGVNDVIDRILKEFKKHNIAATKEEILFQMNRLASIALKQVAEEYPKALGKDHMRVGD